MLKYWLRPTIPNFFERHILTFVGLFDDKEMMLHLSPQKYIYCNIMYIYNSYKNGMNIINGMVMYTTGYMYLFFIVKKDNTEVICLHFNII